MTNLNLVLVESPTKSKTLQRFLGGKYRVEATMGHIRDLPKGEFGVDIEKNFEPQYVIPRDKRKLVNQLKKEARGVKTLWLATDPDREGEAIAWHIKELLVHSSELVDKNKKSKNYEPRTTNSLLIHRVVFHEITEEAIKEAFKNPRSIDSKLVDAQQARRVLDRLVGYKLSPLLWQKVKRGLSAGRVQSVVLRLVVDREREIGAFKPVEYWTIEAELEKHKVQGTLPQGQGDTERSRSVTRHKFTATLIEKNGKKLAIKNETEASGHVKNLQGVAYQISKITQKEVRRYPYPPFTTSTIQQAAASRLGMSAKKTMMLAQNLYEHGFITYMRTDSFNLSPSAITSARSYIEKSFGKNYLPATGRIYRSKSKNVQEAHEAIRPTRVELKAEDLSKSGGLTRDHLRLYDLIWRRFLACQMNEGILDQTSVDVKAENYLFRATGSVVKFDGWLKLYQKGEEDEVDRGAQVLPELTEGEGLKLLQLIPDQHFTEPPPRYTEASLIKKLEELGIGRPSTYAPILSTIQERFYVEKQEKKFVPTPLGFAVTDFLVKYFPQTLDFNFTAQMEDELDDIARGERQWKPTVKNFYTPFEKRLAETATEAEKVKLVVEYAGKKCPKCGKELIVRIGRFGKFLACSGFPDCKHTEALEEVINAKCPQDGGEIVVRHTRRGKTFYGCKNWPGCKYASWTKPK